METVWTVCSKISNMCFFNSCQTVCSRMKIERFTSEPSVYSCETAENACKRISRNTKAVPQLYIWLEMSSQSQNFQRMKESKIWIVGAETAVCRRFSGEQICTYSAAIGFGPDGPWSAWERCFIVVRVDGGDDKVRVIVVRVDRRHLVEHLSDFGDHIRDR